MKIVYVIDTLASKGGAERILCDKMNYMAEHFGYDVYVVTCYQHPHIAPNVYYLSDKVTQIDLCIRYYRQYTFRYPQRLWVKYSAYRKLVHDLTEVVQRIDPDILVGVGYFNADVITSLKCRAIKIVESHEARIYTLTNKGLARNFLSRAFMKVYRLSYLRRVERQADVVVTLTQGDAREWKKAKRVEVIPNFTVMPVIKLSTCENKRVVAVGRLEWQKGFDRLIEAWTIVYSRYPDWHLDIFGSGALEQDLKCRIDASGLDGIVTIHPFVTDINVEYSEGSIFALSSRYEGFGLVLLEAMKSGLPCVTFDCPFGPGDIVADNQNGFVVKNNDITTFADRLCQLIEDINLRKRFSQASVERARLYDVEKIMNRWKTLYEGCLAEHRKD